MSTEQQVITIDHISEETAPVVYVQNGLKPFLQMIKDEVCGEVPDLSTVKGRDRIASLAFTVSKRKAAVEKPGRDYLRKIKELPKVIELELREFVRDADALRDSIRKPLTDWEAADVARRDKHTDAVQAIKDLAVFAEIPSSAQVAQVIADLELVALDDSWQEFLPEAAQVKDRSLATLRALLADRTKHEAELAAIAQFNAEQAKREQEARDAEIARKASEQARIDAEQKAQAERDAAAKREQDLKDQAAAQQRAAEQKIRDAEAEAERQKLQIKLQEEQAARQKLEAEQERIAATQRAEQERIAAEKRQAEAVERARLAEIDRANKAAAEIVRQQELRAADTAHKASINRAALEAFIAGGMPEDCARQAVTLIAQRKIPNISIQY